MNVVFVKHGGSKEYCFEVPEFFTTYIKKDMIVLVDTVRGLDIGTTTTNVISGDGAQDIAEKNGAYFPLKKVVSFVDANIFNAVKNKIVSRLNDMDSDGYVLPF